MANKPRLEIQDSSEYPAYNQDARCQKCRHKEIGVEFIAANEYHAAYMERNCLRCGYPWREAPLDAE